MTDIEKMAREAGMEVVMYMTNPPRLMGATANAKQLEAFAQAVARRCAEIAMTCPVDAYCTEAHFRQRDNQRNLTAAAIRAEFGIKEEP